MVYDMAHQTAGTGPLSRVYDVENIAMWVHMDFSSFTKGRAPNGQMDRFREPKVVHAINFFFFCCFFFPIFFLSGSLIFSFEFWTVMMPIDLLKGPFPYHAPA
jgi:hypothetical protein